jgi:hypothetical protein
MAVMISTNEKVNQQLEADAVSNYPLLKTNGGAIIYSKSAD